MKLLLQTTSAFSLANWRSGNYHYLSRSRYYHRHLFSSSHNLQTKKESDEGKTKQKLQRSVKRESRIFDLEHSLDELTTPERKELDGLLEAGVVFEEQYDPSGFTKGHVDFKRQHNDVFVRLIEYVEEGRRKSSDGDESTTALFSSFDSSSTSSSISDLTFDSAPEDDPSSLSSINILYLDGPDAGTSLALKDAGINPERCFVPNRHRSTCDTLLELIPGINVAHASASEAMLEGVGSFSRDCFSAFYLDGCGGHAPMIDEMISAAFLPRVGVEESELSLRSPIVIGFSILGGNRDVVDKEQSVVRNLVRLVKPFGLRVDHVLDDVERYGITENVNKIEGGTMTTWLMIERDVR